MRLCVVSGSSRENSSTIRVAKYLKKNFEKITEIQKVELIDFVENDFPSVGRKDITEDNLSPFQYQLVHSMKNSYLIIFCLPEYNWSTNPEVINVIHQLGKKGFLECFDNKVFATVGVSIGRGGRIPCINFHTLLNKVISFLPAMGIVSPLIFESQETDLILDKNGDLIQSNERFIKGINSFIEYSYRMTKKFCGI